MATSKRSAEVQSSTKVKVELGEDHLLKIAGTSVEKAIQELIWNALDADAEHVSVKFERGGTFGGTTALIVEDDGHGMSFEEAVQHFGTLGNSWKSGVLRSIEAKRLLHGKNGAGRFRAFALGDVEWTTLAASKESRPAIVITGQKDSPGTFDVVRGRVVEPETVGGTIVRVAPVSERVDELVTDDVFQRLCGEFGPYLHQYPGVKIEIDGKALDSASLIINSETTTLSDVKLTSNKVAKIEVEILEWVPEIAIRRIYLCDVGGFALHSVASGLNHYGINYTVHAKSDFFEGQMAIDGYSLAEMDSDVQAAIGAVKDVLRNYLRKRNSEANKGRVEEWKSQEVYPYEGEPTTPQEAHERQVFNIVASNVADFLPGFEKGDAPTKRLGLRLIRQALQQNPVSLGKILSELVELPKERQDALAELLGYTTLSHIIQASKTVGDRLSFLHMLQALVFDDDSNKHLKERSQLHRLLAANTWIFGEQYNLVVDDQSLTQLLVKHLARDDRLVLVENEVLREDGRRGIVDLVLGRALRPHGNAYQENLVIELKRPSVKITPDVLEQIDSYAWAIMKEPRFNKQNTKWTFLAVSTDLDERADAKANQAERPAGMVYLDKDGRYSIWAKRWTEIIGEARTGLDFVNTHLKYAADDASAAKLIDEQYAELFVEKGVPATRLEKVRAK